MSASQSDSTLANLPVNDNCQGMVNFQVPTQDFDDPTSKAYCLRRLRILFPSMTPNNNPKIIFDMAVRSRIDHLRLQGLGPIPIQLHLTDLLLDAWRHATIRPSEQILCILLQHISGSPSSSGNIVPTCTTRPGRHTTLKRSRNSRISNPTDAPQGGDGRVKWFDIPEFLPYESYEGAHNALLLEFDKDPMSDHKLKACHGYRKWRKQFACTKCRLRLRIFSTPEGGSRLQYRPRDGYEHVYHAITTQQQNNLELKAFNASVTSDQTSIDNNEIPTTQSPKQHTKAMSSEGDSARKNKRKREETSMAAKAFYEKERARRTFELVPSHSTWSSAPAPKRNRTKLALARVQAKPEYNQLHAAGHGQNHHLIERKEGKQRQEKEQE